MSDFYPIARFSGPAEAHIAKGLLEQHGVFCYLANEHTADLGIPAMSGHYELRVATSDLDTAIELLSEFGDEVLAEKLKRIERCPACGSPDVGYAINGWRLALRAMVGLDNSRLKAQRRCRQCGAKWNSISRFRTG
jgi:hypothetical protein